MSEGLARLQAGDGDPVWAFVSKVRGIPPGPGRQTRARGRDLGPNVPSIVPVLGVGILLVVDDAVAVVLRAC